MKITGIKTYKFSVATGQKRVDPYTGGQMSSTSKAWLFLKLETDTELVGWGEGTGEWLVPTVETMLHDWAELLVGQDPLRVVALTDDITSRLPWKGGPVIGTAAAAVNAALYDLAGKAWDVPVHVILGGKRRDRVRVYTGGGIFASPDRAAEVARNKLEDGYSGIKGNPLESRRWPMDRGAGDHCLECLAAIREAVGDQLDVMLDTHGSPQPELSIEFARRVASYRPLFLEEPVRFGSVAALQEVSRKSPVPIATGEKLFSLRDFMPLIDARACAFLQPDVTHCFGITNLVEIARRAADAQMLIAPHNAGGPLCLGASLAVDAVVDNFLIQEMNDQWLREFHLYVDHDWKVQNGYINVSDRPGLGVDVKESDLEGLPYVPMAYRQYYHEDGSWKGW